MMKKYKQAIFYGSTALTALLASTGANAAIDLTAVTGAIDDMQAAITTVGAALVVVAAVAISFKWIKGALFS